jgi:hypothetical protein
MRFILAAILLSACSTTKTPDPAPAPPVDDLAKVGEKIDKSDSRVAAAVTVAVENSDKPEVVKAEGKVALAYLPTPTATDVEFARARALKNDQKAYQAQMDYATKMKAEVDKMWAKAEADAKKSKADIQALKDENARLTAEIERIKKESSRDIWTLTGAALVVLGGAACAFASIRIGIPIILAGAFAGAVPYIIDSQYFEWTAAGTLLCGASLAVWWMYDKVRDSIKSDGNDKQP